MSLLPHKQNSTPAIVEKHKKHHRITLAKYIEQIQTLHHDWMPQHQWKTIREVNLANKDQRLDSTKRDMKESSVIFCLQAYVYPSCSIVMKPQ